MAKKNDCVVVEGDGKYPLVPVDAIEIVSRDEDRLFCNPRSAESFEGPSMDSLKHSIQLDGLQQPLSARAYVEDDVVTKVELIAGERRLRNIRSLIEEDAPCYDEDLSPPEKYKKGQWVLYNNCFVQVVKQKGDEVVVSWGDETSEVPASELLPTTPASKLYAKVPCKLVHNCEDGKALRLAFRENHDSERLTICEEIALVERLTRRGLKQSEIAEMILGDKSNVTWVSQTANFRSQLPEEAFNRLISGDFSRSFAITLMTFRPEDRDAVYAASVAAEKSETESKLREFREQIEEFEDEADIALAEREHAEKSGDQATAKRAEKKQAAAVRRAEKAAEKKTRAESEAGTLREGHVLQGAASIGVNPKTARILPKKDMQKIYVDGVGTMLQKGVVDNVCEEDVPELYLQLVQATARGILSGERDPLAVIRSVLMDRGDWEEARVPRGSMTKSGGSELLDDSPDEYEAEFMDDSFDEYEAEEASILDEELGSFANAGDFDFDN